MELPKRLIERTGYLERIKSSHPILTLAIVMKASSTILSDSSSLHFELYPSMHEVLIIPGERPFGIRSSYSLPSHLLLIQQDDVVALLLCHR